MIQERDGIYFKSGQVTIDRSDKEGADGQVLSRIMLAVMNRYGNSSDDTERPSPQRLDIAAYSAACSFALIAITSQQ